MGAWVIVSKKRPKVKGFADLNHPARHILKRTRERDGANMKTETWVRLAAIGICAVCAGVGGYVLIRYFSGILLPFAAAALVAS